MPNTIGVSKLLDAACLEVIHRAFKKLVELSVLGVLLNLSIPFVSSKLLEPSAKLGEFIGRQFRHGFFEFFNAHGLILA